jgi:hypothetical protein
MSYPPHTPRVMSGALVSLDPFNPVSSVVSFQYNPATMTRNLQPQTAGSTPGARAEATRIKGPPIETIEMEVEIDALDRDSTGEKEVPGDGIYPQLAALEMIMYPKVAQVLTNGVLAKLGMLEVLPIASPLTVLVWGRRRIVPVRLQGFRVSEEAYDTELSPIRAKIDLVLRVLSYDDLAPLSLGSVTYLKQHGLMEYLASKQSVRTIGEGFGA